VRQKYHSQKSNRRKGSSNIGVQQRRLKTVAGEEKRKTPGGKNSGLHTKRLPASAQHRDIKKHTSSSQASGDGDRARPSGTILLTAAAVNQQLHQQEGRKKLATGW